MRTGIFAAFVFCSLFSSSAFSQAEIDSVFAKRLQDKIDSCVNHYDLPGISVALLLPNDRYWYGASGVSDIYSLDPMTTDHLFQMASTTKMFVSALVFQLAEEGLLSIEDSIGTYLPPVMHVPGNTKIKYLLNQRSGLYDFIAQNPATGNNWFAYPDSIWEPKTAIETYGDSPMFAQGAGFYYSNTNYVLLGMLIEEVTGHTYAQELRDRILTPYGLTQAFMPPADSVLGIETPGWTSFTALGVYDTDASVMLNDCFASMVFTAGAMVSKPADVAKFTRLLYTGNFLHDTSLVKLKQCTNVSFSDGCNGYGYGSMRYTFSGSKTFFGHSGDISGFTQFSAHNLPDSITLTVSINRNSAPRGPIVQDILSVVYDQLAGVQDVHFHDELSVCPNPATSYIEISATQFSPGDRLEICNMTGEVLLMQNMQGIKQNIDISSLQNGIYLVRAISNKYTVTKKIVVER